MSLQKLFKITAFRDLWLGQSISRFGDALYFLGFMFMVQKVTHRFDMVGYVGAAETLPYLIVSFYAGALADKVDRRKIMFWSDTASALVLVGFWIIVLIYKTPPTWSLFVLPFLLSSARAFFMPAKNASIPRVVSPDQVLAANSVSMMTDQLVWLSSLAVSGGILAMLFRFQPTTFYLSFIGINLLSFAGSAFFIFRLPKIQPENNTVHEGILGEIKSGINYAVTDRVILLSLIAQIGISLSISPFFVVYIATNEQWFGGKPETLSWIESAFVGGLFVASLYVAKVKVNRPGLAFGISLGITGFTIAMMAFSQNYWAFLFWNLLAGVAIAFVDLPMMTYTQLSVPDQYRGRVMSIKNLIMMGVQPIGAILGGTVVNVLGIFWAYLIMGIGFGASGAAPLLDKKFREVPMPDIPPLENSGQDQLDTAEELGGSQVPEKDSATII